jgi:hypothetical protein
MEARGRGREATGPEDRFGRADPRKREQHRADEKKEGGVEPVDIFRIGAPNSESAAAIVDSVARMGVDLIKVRTVESLETYRAIAAAAKKNHLALVGHSVASPEELIKAGQRSIEHSFYPSLSDRTKERRAELFRRLVAEGIEVTPTLVVGDALMVPADTAAAVANDARGGLDPRRKYLSGYLIEDWREQAAERKDMDLAELAKFLSERLRGLRETREEGVRLAPGTDAAALMIWPGFSLHDELRLMTEQIGMTPWKR